MVMPAIYGSALWSIHKISEGEQKPEIPFDLIYFEGCENRDDTKARIYLTSGMGKRYLKNRVRHLRL